jgi:hypothetical protein
MLNEYGFNEIEPSFEEYDNLSDIETVSYEEPEFEEPEVIESEVEEPAKTVAESKKYAEKETGEVESHRKINIEPEKEQAEKTEGKTEEKSKINFDMSDNGLDDFKSAYKNQNNTEDNTEETTKGTEESTEDNAEDNAEDNNEDNETETSNESYEEYNTRYESATHVESTVENPYQYYARNYQNCDGCKYREQSLKAEYQNSQSETQYTNANNNVYNNGYNEDDDYREAETSKKNRVNRMERRVIKFSPKTLIYTGSLVAIILVLILVAVFTGKSKTVNTKDDNVVLANAGSTESGFQFVTSTSEETYSSAYNDAYSSIQNATTNKWKTLDELSFYIDGELRSILAGEKVVENEYQNGEVTADSYLEQMNDYSEQVNTLNHLLIANKTLYDNEDKTEEYNTLLDNLNTVIIYGDSSVYNNIK